MGTSLHIEKEDPENDFIIKDDGRAYCAIDDVRPLEAADYVAEVEYPKYGKEFTDTEIDDETGEDNEACIEVTQEIANDAEQKDDSETVTDHEKSSKEEEDKRKSDDIKGDLSEQASVGGFVDEFYQETKEKIESFAEKYISGAS